MAQSERLETLYELITDDDQNQVCDSIPEEACTGVPRNFFLNAVNGTMTKLADQLASPGLVLPWLLDALGTPTTVVGFLTPVRRTGALLPQLSIAGRIRSLSKRKYAWALGAGLFGFWLLMMIPAALFTSGLVAGILIVLLLALASLGRAISSISFKDVLSKTIPKGSRGTLLAMRATLGGLLAVGAGFAMRLYVPQSSEIWPYLLLVGIGGALWVLSLIPIFLTEEEPGATEGQRNGLQEAREGMKLLREIPGLRKFIYVRAALLTIELGLPFYTLYARRLTGAQASDLGVFVVAASLAQVLSSPIWGRLSDRDSRIVMGIAGGLAVSAGVLALLIGWLPLLPNTTALLAIVILLQGFAISGVRLGRNTYLVDGVPSDDRPLYFAVVNTLAGVLTLAGGLLGSIADLFGLQVLIGLLIGLGFLGILLVRRLPEVENFIQAG